MNRYVFGRLYAEPSFFEGIARVLDVGGTLQEYNSSESDREADVAALNDDWRAVGEDLRSSIEEYGRERAPSRPA